MLPLPLLPALPPAALSLPKLLLELTGISILIGEPGGNCGETGIGVISPLDLTSLTLVRLFLLDVTQEEFVDDGSSWVALFFRLFGEDVAGAGRSPFSLGEVRSVDSREDKVPLTFWPWAPTGGAAPATPSISFAMRWVRHPIWRLSILGFLGFCGGGDNLISCSLFDGVKAGVSGAEESLESTGKEFVTPRGGSFPMKDWPGTPVRSSNVRSIMGLKSAGVKPDFKIPSPI